MSKRVTSSDDVIDQKFTRLRLAAFLRSDRLARIRSSPRPFFSLKEKVWGGPTSRRVIKIQVGTDLDSL